MTINVEIVKNYSEWREYKLINKALIKKITRDILERFKNFNNIKQFELSILLTNDAEILTLNKQFRNIDRTTNVLSFPAQDLYWQDLYFNKPAEKGLEEQIKQFKLSELEFPPNSYYMYLGDIAFSYQVIFNESCSSGKIFENHFIHLLIHSILHLIGFDHQNDKEANIMENLEIKILESFGISSPY